MINSIVNLHNSINQFSANKIMLPYSVSVGTQRVVNMRYCVSQDEQSLLSVHCSVILKSVHSTLNVHYSTISEQNTGITIVRKNEND